MIQTIRVTSRIGNDLAGASVLHDINHTLKISSITNVLTAKIYRLEGITPKLAETLAQNLLVEEITHAYSINSNRKKHTNQIEIAYKPGVMNPQVASILKSAKDLHIPLIAADISTEYIFEGSPTKKEVETITNRLLMNKTIQYVVEKEPITLLFSGKPGKTKIVPIRTLNDEKLLLLSKDSLFLNLEEMKIIQHYFVQLKRDPTDGELETLAQTWSEHCAHKTFKAKIIIDGIEKEPLFSRIKKVSHKFDKNIISAFDDNSGVIDFYDGYAICGKVETHNSPSAIEPYGGAMTGSGGVFRDIVGTGKGARVIASTDMFCVAPPNYPFEKLPVGTLEPQYILRRVVAGVRDYGNRLGIPTNNGSVHFHNDFRAKPSVIAGGYGIVKKTLAQKGKPKKGDLILLVGGATGRDGIHGSTFSSGAMTDKTLDLHSQAVQIGNAIEEKRMFDAIYICAEKRLIRAITDCGAGGLSSAIGEMGAKTGVKVHLEKVPLKYIGLSPWEIWISESQERMVLAIDPKNKKKVSEIFQKYNVTPAFIGTFTDDKKLSVRYEKESVVDLSMEFLHHGLPQRTMVGVRKEEKTSNNEKNNGLEEKNIKTIYKKVMADFSICSKEAIIRMYDHNIQGSSALPPFTGVDDRSPNDAVVLAPLLGKKYGMVISHGLNPILNKIDPYAGSIWAAVEAVSNYVAVGGDIETAALIDNFIWPFPDEESLFDLDRSVDACVDFAYEMKLPFVSGKDSLSSTYISKDETIKIPPVLCISVFGKIPNVAKTISSDFKKTNSVLLFIGTQDTNALGGSAFSTVLHKKDTQVPTIDLKKQRLLFKKLHKHIVKGNILASHDVSEGGIAVAVAEMCFGGGVGADIEIESIENFFNETPGCFILEVEKEKVSLFEDLPYRIIGKTVKEKIITVSQKKKKLVSIETDELEKAWKKPMEEIFN